MQEHFGIAHVLENRLLSEDEFRGDGAVKKFDRSNLLGLSGKYFPDLKATELEILKKVCRYTHPAEEFFLLNVNARNQWLRTVIGHANLGPDIWTKAECSEFDSDIIIRSNILPYDPHWTSDFRERRVTGIECELGKHGSEDGSCEQLRILRKGKEAADRKKVMRKRLAKGDAKGVWLVTLEGGQFIGKTGDKRIIDVELEVLKKVYFHPHIVYGFVHPCEEARELCEETVCETCEEAREFCEETSLCEFCKGTPISAYFMEYMAYDLRSFIHERMRKPDDKPPFEIQDSVDVLLQIAKAMKHMHDVTVNVVHCDLKSDNILISEIVTSDNEKHYLVKVADFGSALSGCTGHFEAGSGTTPYSAPEALKQRKDKKLLISFPHGIDVYSYGIVAFEVLTGIFKHLKDSESSPTKFKDGVFQGVRPLFPDFIQDKELISLVKECWRDEPKERPSFVDICKKLDKVRDRISAQSDNPGQANSCNSAASVHEGHRAQTSESGEELLQTKRKRENEESVPALSQTYKRTLDVIRSGIARFL